MSGMKPFVQVRIRPQVSQLRARKEAMASSARMKFVNGF
jgi:hypothetical protein